jgi:Xaa-Pro dipeptidase
MVTTIEPGVYAPGELGVRIEDVVQVTDDGPERLTSLATSLQVVG